MADLKIFPFSSITDAYTYFDLKEEIDTAFIRILEYLKNYHEVNTIIVENQYIDKDFSSELSSLYCKTFRCRRGYCQRLHFIREEFGEKQLSEFLDSFQKGQITYLGFLVKRPIEVGKVGRTLILPKHFRNFFYLCTIKREVHLLGKTIMARGIPFIEQDSMVITCAQASMWVVSNFMHHKYQLPRYFPYDITERATKYFIDSDRAMPSSGLSIDQMNSALNNMGYFPILQSRPRKIEYEERRATYEEALSIWDPVETIYQYIESKIPVIVSFNSHVITIVGHKMSDEKSCNFDQNQVIISTSNFTDAFIIHDDVRSIYGLLPIDTQEAEKLKLKYQELLPRMKLGERSLLYGNVLDDIDDILIPLPDKIFLLGEDAYQITIGLFSGGHDSFDAIDVAIKQADKGNKYALEIVSSSEAGRRNPLTFRTYFIRSVEFKRKVKKSTLSDEVTNYYIQMDMPRYIWIVEISTYEIYSKDNKLIGEIIFDSTANKFDINGSVLSIHLPGYFYQNKIISDLEIIDEDLPIEEPYILNARLIEYNCEMVGD